MRHSVTGVAATSARNAGACRDVSGVLPAYGVEERNVWLGLQAGARSG